MAEGSIGILAIDDEPVDIAVIRTCLESAGYTVLVGANYDEGIVALEAHPNRIDLLITDVSLPGKTGLELAKECLRRKPDLKILLISGWAGAEFLEFVGIPKEDPHFLSKPFRSSELIDRVREILQSTDQIAWLAANTNKAASGQGS
ncbi:MAG: response regulator [Acidobacteriia bacterium]|nr:response regulator [Terriglobia bacterium]